MGPHEALTHISEIRQQLAGAGTYRGLRSAAVAATGVFGVLGAFAQAKLLPPADAASFLTLWCVVAAASVAVVAWAMVMRVLRTASRWERDQAIRMAEAIVPSLVVGGLVTAALVSVATDHSWMLPGLWAALTSLAVFAARRMLSPAVTWVGVWYAAASLVCLGWGRDVTLTPWLMGATFGGGQLLAAAVLFVTVERGDG